MKATRQDHVFFFSLENFSLEENLTPIEHHFNDDTAKAEMEKALEDKRKAKYENYPSRLNCIFVAPTEESANEWCKSVKSMLWASRGCYLEYYIYELVGTNEIYWFDADILHNNNLEEMSDEYWASCSQTKPLSTSFDIEGITNRGLKIVSKKKMCLDRNRIYKEIHA